MKSTTLVFYIFIFFGKKGSFISDKTKEHQATIETNKTTKSYNHYKGDQPPPTPRWPIRVLGKFMNETIKTSRNMGKWNVFKVGAQIFDFQQNKIDCPIHIPIQWLKLPQGHPRKGWPWGILAN